MNFAHGLVAVAVTVTVGVVGPAVLFAGPAVAARAGSSWGSVDESRLTGPGVDISVTVPAGWRQIHDQSHPQLLQMVYPETCSVGLECASAMARVFSMQASSAQAGAETAEQAIAGQPGIQGRTVTSQGPVQVATRPGYQVRFIYSNANAKFQAAIAAVETGPVSSGVVPISLVFVTVSDLAGAPSASVIDQIVGSTQLTAG